MMRVEKWGLWELAVSLPENADPFGDTGIVCEFTHGGNFLRMPAFYEGEGRYLVRFMPEDEGEYCYQLMNRGIVVQRGSFLAAPPSPGNHGPVRAEGSRLVYADGTPCHCLGTTCYAWVHQGPERRAQTLDTLKNSAFNKLRMCVFPKYYKYNTSDPALFPYERLEAPEGEYRFDFSRFDPAFFRLLDRQIAALMELGIEADLILFHPYDRWGFSTMPRPANDRYLAYMAARYSAFRNVWWSMANEYDLTDKSVSDWEHYGRLITGLDPFHHLCSIHNCVNFYDYRQDWISHCSMQRNDWYLHVQLTDKHIAAYGKPVVWDEIGYEGNIDLGWGNISGQEMVYRFWEAVLRGGYPGHGETFEHPEGVLWWSHGGVLHGESEPRLRFLKQIWDSVPGGVLQRAEGCFDELVSIPVGQTRQWSWESERPAAFELRYYGICRPSYRELRLGEGHFRVEVIDTWNMTISDAGIHTGNARIELPGREWLALRLTRV